MTRTRRKEGCGQGTGSTGCVSQVVMPRPPTPVPLAATAAHLVATGRLTLQALRPHLEPDLDAKGSAHAARDARALREAQAVGRVSLTLSSAAKAEKEAEEAAASAAAARTDAAEDAANQWLVLLLAALQADLWGAASDVMRLLQRHGGRPLLHEPVARALCGAIGRFIAPVVAPLAPVRFSDEPTCDGGVGGAGKGDGDACAMDTSARRKRGRGRGRGRCRVAPGVIHRRAQRRWWPTKGSARSCTWTPPCSCACAACSRRRPSRRRRLRYRTGLRAARRAA